MKLRNLGLALTAVCATVAGVVGTANNAYAGTATADVNFSGSMPDTCAFSTIRSGRVDMSGTAISTSNISGDVAYALLTCTGTGTVTISDPIQTSGTTLTFIRKVTTADASGKVLQSQGGNSYGFDGETSRTISATTENYSIRMFMTTTALIPPGSYGFKTTLTVTY